MQEYKTQFHQQGESNQPEAEGKLPGANDCLSNSEASCHNTFNFNGSGHITIIAPSARSINYYNNLEDGSPGNSEWKKVEKLTQEEMQLYYIFKNVDAMRACIKLLAQAKCTHDIAKVLICCVIHHVISTEEVVKAHLFNVFRPFCPSELQNFTEANLRTHINNELEILHNQSKKCK